MLPRITLSIKWTCYGAVVWMNSIFIPPGKNPFQLPPLPQNRYVPSPSKDIQDKNVTLTPQKPHHRHEYSLPPEVYTPDQYSIYEENSASAKPPALLRDDNVEKDLQEFLNDVETWNSLQFCEQWPSKENVSSEDSSFMKPIVDSTMPESSRPLTSTARNTRTKLSVPSATKDRPLRIKTSFASDRNASQADSQRSSNIQMRLNRFRYGDPKPSEKRKKERLKSQTPPLRNLSSVQTSVPDFRPPSASIRKSATPHHDFGQKGFTPPQPGSSFPKPPFPSDSGSSPRPADPGVSTLNTKLEKLLQESTLMMSSPEPPSSARSSTEKSGGSFQVSSLDSTESSELKTQTESSKFMSPESMTQLRITELPRKMLWQNENLSPEVALPHSPQKTRKEDDILYRWRLRRKLETARENVERGRGLPTQHSTAHASSYIQNLAEKPFPVESSKAPLHHSPAPLTTHHNCCCEGGRQAPQQPPINPPETRGARPEVKSVAVGVSEMVSCETQTGKSLMIFEDEVVSSEDVEHVQRTDSTTGISQAPGRPAAVPHSSTPASGVSFHRVKIVEADLDDSPQTAKGSPRACNFSPMSGKTEATTVWSSTGNNKRSEEEKSTVSSGRASHPHFTSDSESRSPTADVVKQVIGSRLFNTSQSPSSSSSAVSRLKERKNSPRSVKIDSTEQMNGSYTTSKRSSEKDSGDETELEDSPSPSPARSNKSSEAAPEQSQNVAENQSENGPLEFDPEKMLERLLQDIADDPNDFPNDVVMTTLRKQREQFLQEFRSIQEQLDERTPTEDFEEPEKTLTS